MAPNSENNSKSKRHIKMNVVWRRQTATHTHTHTHTHTQPSRPFLNNIRLPFQHISFFPREHNRPALISTVSYIISTLLYKEKEFPERERGHWNESSQEEKSSLQFITCHFVPVVEITWKNIIRTSLWDKLWADWCLLRWSRAASRPQNDTESCRPGLRLKIYVKVKQPVFEYGW